MKLIAGETREEVWLSAIEHLLKEAEDRIEYDLILEISSPGSSNSRSKSIRSDFDDLLAGAREYSVNTVAETIFPLAEYKRNQLAGVTENYPNEIFPLIKKLGDNKRGTYALRIVRGKNSKGEECRPLEAVIKRMRAQIDRGPGIRCAYEIPIDDDIASISINRNDTAVMGFPCLSHLSFKLSRDRSAVHLTAFYRSHHYIKKTLGNLLGLARLQACVAKEVGVDVGPLICHSSFAVLDTPSGIGKQRIQKLIDDNVGDTSASE